MHSKVESLSFSVGDEKLGEDIQRARVFSPKTKKGNPSLKADIVQGQNKSFVMISSEFDSQCRHHNEENVRSFVEGIL